MEVDPVSAILEETDGGRQRHGEAERFGALDLRAEPEMVEANLSLGRELVLPDVAVDRQVELALLDGIAEVLARVGAQRRHIEVAQAQLQIGEEVAVERVDLAGDSPERGPTVHPSAELEVGARGLA